MNLTMLCTSQYVLSNNGLLAHANGLAKFKTIRDMYYTLSNNNIIWVLDNVHYQGFQYTVCTVSSIEDIFISFPEEFI